MGGSLYLVATPIGHLGDFGHRAADVLRRSSAIVCEDTRVTRKLLAAYGIERPLIAHHAHSPAAQVEGLIRRCEAGEDLAVVSDAGTPLVSDPGADLVRLALERGVSVVPIPGPSAILAALVGSGLPPQPFVFVGFLPRAKAAQRELLAPLIRLSMTLVLYEAPSRLARTLGHLNELCGPDRPACVARELTKRFETFERGSLEELERRFQEGTKGEVVVVLGPPETVVSEAAGASELDEEVRRLLCAGVAPSEAAKTLAGAFGIPKREAYQAVLRAGEAGKDP